MRLSSSGSRPPRPAPARRRHRGAAAQRPWWLDEAGSEPVSAHLELGQRVDRDRARAHRPQPRAPRAGDAVRRPVGRRPIGPRRLRSERAGRRLLPREERVEARQLVVPGSERCTSRSGGCAPQASTTFRFRNTFASANVRSDACVVWITTDRVWGLKPPASVVAVKLFNRTGHHRGNEQCERERSGKQPSHTEPSRIALASAIGGVGHRWSAS
jgi:hypothetical protein